jgi:ABC-type bacteriocin/lantibiotic exporter with double-glycine peptidase domain
MKTYKQTTCETCLASSLLLLAGVKSNQNKEMEILTYGLKFTKWNFSIGQLDFVARKYRKTIVTYVEDRRLYNLFRRLPISERIKVVQANIGLKLIKRLVKRPLIVYVDDYLFRKELHYPHFVVVWQLERNNFLITDPWDGKMKRLTPLSLSKGIKLLKNTLKFSPQIIQIS